MYLINVKIVVTNKMMKRPRIDALALSKNIKNDAEVINPEKIILIKMFSFLLTK